ncbi:MAG: response regulator [Anaerolineae bacterium]|nr:response regulator [Anaerolineae bacterium]
MSRILLIDDDINLLQMVKLMLERVGHQVETAKDGTKGLEMAAQTQPELAIIDVMMSGLSGYDVVRKLREDPRTVSLPVVILTARSQPMDKEMALEAGANAFLSKPVTAQELTERVDAVIRAGVHYRVHTGLLTEPIPRRAGEISGVLTPVPPPLPRPTPPPPTPIVRSTGRVPIGAEDQAQPATAPPVQLPVTTVISLRGGTGCTTIAINLALALAAQARRICITDLSAVGGHVPLYLHLKPQHSWQDFLSQGDSPDLHALGGLLAQHEPSGVAVLAAPPRPADGTLSAAAAQHVLRELTATYNPVVADARQLDPAVRGALQVSSSVVVVMSDDPPSVQTTSQLLAMLSAMEIEMGRIRVVLNHVRPTFDVPADAIQKALKRPISVDVPYEPGQPVAIRRGTPLVSARPDSPFAQSIQQLARTVVS